MINRSAIIGLVVAALACSHTAHAELSVLAGTFEGTEPSSVVVWSGFDQRLSFATQQIKLSVSATGTYDMADLYEDWYFGNAGTPGLGVLTALYQGAFNPQQPALNRLGVDEWSTWPRTLQAGVEYTLALQNYSPVNARGVWTLVFNGLGEVISEKRASAPNLVEGRFTGGEDKLDNGCTSNPASYQVQGPFNVSNDGTYYFTYLLPLFLETLKNGNSGICFSVYAGSPDLENLQLNRLMHVYQYFRATVSLQSNTDYYLLVESVSKEPSDYTFLVVPPTPFGVTPHMSGLWADPATDGQGLMLNVYPSIDAMHLAWFTYDLELPSSQEAAQIGDAGHRWLTAFGELEGSGSNMTITRTQGGIFDAAQPVPAQIQDGSVQLHFDSCTSGTLIYDLGSVHATGQLNLRRPFEDAANIDRCVLANMGPGIPGPL